MTLSPDEFIRRFLLHTLPRGFHRIRHYGLLAGATRKASLKRARQLLKVAPPAHDGMPVDPPNVRPPCPCCGGQMIVIETFERRYQPARHRPTSPHPGARRRDPARHIQRRPRHIQAARNGKRCARLAEKRT